MAGPVSGSRLVPPRGTSSTDRDLELLELVHEHRVFTTGQLEALFFTAPQLARRLLILYRHAALLRSRPWTPTGSAPWHGSSAPPAPPFSLPATASRSPTSATTPVQQSGSACSRSSATSSASTSSSPASVPVPATVRMRGWWRGGQRNAAYGRGATRPDAYGRWREDGLEVDFFLEHDTGTEPLTKVAAKLAGYATLAEATGVSTPVLFRLPSTARETNLRAAIATPEVPVATAVHTPAIRTRGGEYTGELFKRACAAAGITQSMGRTTSALDNAVAEAFNSTLEMELLSRSRFASRERPATQWPSGSMSTTPSGGTRPRG